MSIADISWDMILGGFGLFMFGITFMGDGLKSVAGDKMKEYIDKYTSNPFSAVLIGIVLTIIMQSSSASTAITIGLVRAGLMNLEQAAGIVMGANIGTTVTSFLISLNIEQYAMYAVFLGAMMICFGKKKKFIYWGDVVLGFGLIFYGLAAMGDALAVLKEVPEFEQFAIQMSSNKFLAFGAGVLLTAIVQSSAATIGVIQKLYAAGAMTFSASIPFMFGANIGTTMTGVLAAIGGSTAGKRTAGLHTMVNIIGGCFGMIILIPYSSFITWLSNSLSLQPMMQIAVANIIFKTCTTIVFIPFIKPLVNLIRKIVPGNEPEKMEVNIDELDANVSYILPSAAVDASKQAILKMVDVVREDIVQTKDFLNKPGTNDDADILKSNESMINKFDHQITDFLIRLQENSSAMTIQDVEDLRLNFEVVKNLERLGDLAMNLTEFYLMVFEEEESFTESAIKDMNAMFDQLLDMYDESIEVYATKDPARYETVRDMEITMDKMEYVSRREHFKRMSNHECDSAVASSVYCDILGNLERMGDHCCNIAKSAATSTVDDISTDEVIAK